METNPNDQAAPATVAAFFDVDNTIIKGASAFHLGKELYARGFFRKRDLFTFAFLQARYSLIGENQEQIDQVRSRALSIMQGHSVAEVVAIGEEVYDQVLGLRIFPGTQSLLNDHLSKGHEVWLITATPIEIGDLIARRLGASGALATIAEHKAGHYTGRLVGDMMHGKAKAAAILKLAAERNIDLTESFAYGDSFNDLPLLQSVGNPCPINPEYRLRKHAKKVGWPVREFRGKRKAAKNSFKTASYAGAAWASYTVLRQIYRRVRGLLGK